MNNTPDYSLYLDNSDDFFKGPNIIVLGIIFVIIGIIVRVTIKHRFDYKKKKNKKNRKSKKNNHVLPMT